MVLRAKVLVVGYQTQGWAALRNLLGRLRPRSSLHSRQHRNPGAPSRYRGVQRCPHGCLLCASNVKHASPQQKHIARSARDA